MLEIWGLACGVKWMTLSTSKYYTSMLDLIWVICTSAAPPRLNHSHFHLNSTSSSLPFHIDSDPEQCKAENGIQILFIWILRAQ